MRQYICTILLLLLFSISKLTAQSLDEKNFKQYTVKDGLSNNEVTAITQDQYGYMWIATSKGLNRFDGSNFLQFYSDSSRNSLPEDRVKKLIWLDNVQLAAITQSGLHIMNTESLEHRNLVIPPDSLKLLSVVNYVRDVTADSAGNVFVLSRTGFYQFDRQDRLTFRYDHYSVKEMSTKVVRFGPTMIRADGNTILVGCEEGLYKYVISKKSMRPVAASDESFYAQIASSTALQFFKINNYSFVVKMDSTNELFYIDLLNKIKQPIDAPVELIDVLTNTSNVVILNDSLFAINGSDGGFFVIVHQKKSGRYLFRSNQYFQNYWCQSLFIDKVGRLWVGTNLGLFREKKNAANVEQISTQQIGSLDVNSSINTIAVSNNKIFIGTYKQGLWIYDQDSLALLRKVDLSKYRSKFNFVNTLLSVSADTVFAGVDGIWINTKNLTHGEIELPEWNARDGIKALFKDTHGNIYLTKTAAHQFYLKGLNAHAFRVIDFSNNEFRIEYPTHITEDLEGNILFSGSGINRFNYSLQRFDLKLDSFPAIKIKRKSVLSNIAIDKEGIMYFGVYESGLIIYDPVQKKFSQLTRTDGLPDNNILDLCLLNNILWIGTQRGLAKYDLVTKKIFVLGIQDEIPQEYVVGIYFDSSRRQLYVAYANTIVRFDPDKFAKGNTPPAFLIESFTIGGKQIIYHPPNKASISYHDNLIIKLSAINFDNAYQQQFAYRFLNNGNEEWLQIGSQQNVILSNLAPGKHKLQVKVFTNNNSWPEQIKEIIIIVSPPFWNTAAFWIIVVCTLITALTIFYLYRIKSVRRIADIDKQLAELEMKGLHSQMNPHFIFNSLNSIKEMILEDEKQNASRYLSKFAQLIRTNLEQSRQTFVTLKQCIDHLHQYLEMEKIRFEGFTYNIDVDTNLVTDEIQLAPMLIQPLVENAIWHGLHNKKGDKHLHIRFYRSGEQLVCEIDDNGIGIKRSNANRSGLRPAHRSLGISNIHERLVILNEKYKMNCSLKITDKSDSGKQHESGTIVILRVNI